MGHGDEIMATGFAKGAKARGKRIAFGDGVRIRQHPYAVEIFRNNPNVAPPGSERDDDIEWVKHYAGRRLYNRHFGDRWLWVNGFGDRPGEIFFDDAETAWAEKQGKDFILIEPNVPTFKSVAANKQWPQERYNEVAREAMAHGFEVVQLVAPAPYNGGGYIIRGARAIKSPTFRSALAALARARLYIGPEGGLHHGAAAVNRPAVVIFGGFIPPSVTGYSTHTNLAAPGDACGSINPCAHCREAMNNISTTKVLDSTFEILETRKVA